ncbi:MAG TPA: hypothetical protein VG650_14595 [Mycobacteriales bacterium]|nr:hypothetical protein [Mycobacteriales bacterium]
MPSPEFREARDVEPEGLPDLRTAWAWTETAEVDKPAPPEYQESRTRRYVQHGYPADGAASGGGDPAAHSGPLEGVIYDRNADAATQRARLAEGVGATALHAAGRVADVPPQDLGRLPLDDQDITDRTTANRVNLADDVPAVDLKPTYGGYLDVVMHGDSSGTEAHVHGEVTDFSLEDTARLVEQTRGWDHRPVRLLSCSTGQESYAKELANRLQVPVYAPSDVLTVHPDGSTEIENGGRWRRFEPDAR